MILLPSHAYYTESAPAKSPAAAKGKGGGRGTKRSAPSKDKDEEEAKDDAKEAGPSPAKKSKVDAPPPPGGPVEIVFSFDTTGSMYPCLTQVSWPQPLPCQARTFGPHHLVMFMVRGRHLHLLWLTLPYYVIDLSWGAGDA